MSKNIMGFYKNTATNQKGISFEDIYSMTNEQLEENHYYIQWIFPLPEKSRAIPDSPVLRQTDIEQFRNSYELKGQMLKMALKMFNFYGLKIGEGKSKGKIVRADNFEERAKEWLTPHNHNFLRLSRIIRSMKLLGSDPEQPSGLTILAKKLYNCLCDIYEENKEIIGPVTKQYWDEAIEKDV